MKTNKIQLVKLLFLVAITAALFNCKGKQGDPGPAGAKGDTGVTGATGPSLAGTISGVLTLTLANGTQPTDMSGVAVKNNKGGSDTTTTTGAWSLNEVTGIYNLTFSKAGYGTTTVYGSGFVGGGNSYLNTVALSQPPSFTVSLALDTVGGHSTATKDLHINVDFTINSTPPLEQDAEVFVYYSTSSTVDTANYMGLTVITVPAGQTTYKGSITGADLLAAQIESGQIVYMVAYPSSAPAALSSKYVKETTGKTVYTALGQPSPLPTAPVVYVQVPQ